jgi:FkbM family methyltransferase
LNIEDEAQAIGSILRECEHPVIVDLGAYGGEDTAWLIGACRVPPVAIAVEADPDNFARLYAANLKATVIQAAISDHDGECTFYKCYTGRGVGSGSIRQPTGHLDRDGTKYDFRPISVRCLTLDKIARDFALDHIDLLWVDIQAAERDMIAGGQNALQRTRYLFMEAEQGEEMYAGQAMRDELLAMLPGWFEVQRFDFNILLRNDRFVP